MIKNKTPEDEILYIWQESGESDQITSRRSDSLNMPEVKSSGEKPTGFESADIPLSPATRIKNAAQNFFAAVILGVICLLLLYCLVGLPATFLAATGRIPLWAFIWLKSYGLAAAGILLMIIFPIAAVIRERNEERSLLQNLMDW